MTAKPASIRIAADGPESGLSNRIWTPAMSRTICGAGLTAFENFYESIELVIQNYPICCMFAFSNPWVAIWKFLEPPSLP
ncbi:MAG: hypothetical protein JRJ86_24035 [Deltaproteobacteria bacterium]|nr:hypothetical protein [Deltaproteobacteria bacterium]